MSAPTPLELALAALERQGIRPGGYGGAHAEDDHEDLLPAEQLDARSHLAPLASLDSLKCHPRRS